MGEIKKKKLKSVPRKKRLKENHRKKRLKQDSKINKSLMDGWKFIKMGEDLPL